MGRRALTAGILLVVGLPALTLLLSLSNLPGPVRHPVAALVDGLQVLIVVYAAVTGAQLLLYAGSAAARAGRRRPLAPAAPALSPVGDPARAEPARPTVAWTPDVIELRQWSARLAQQIWAQEQRGRAEFGTAVLACLRDGVMLELEHRRRSAALERRAVELEAWIPQDSVVASERM